MHYTNIHKPTLYVGLGGIGCKVLNNIRELFKDETGEKFKSSYIQFLYIDTDPYHLDQCAADKYFLPSSSISELSRVGLPQSLKNNINHLLIKIRASAGFKNFSEGNVDVRIVSSLTGMTGSKLLLPLSLFLSQFDGLDLYGYAVSNQAFECFRLEKLRMNAYAAISELDAIQHASLFNPVIKTLDGKQVKVVSRLFREFYLIGNHNEFNIVLKDEDIIKSLSISMYTSSYISDNKRAADDCRLYNVCDKLAWLSSVGACELVYKGDELAELCSLIAALQICDFWLIDTASYDDAKNFCEEYLGCDANKFLHKLEDVIQLPASSRKRISSIEYDEVKKEVDFSLNTLDIEFIKNNFLIESILSCFGEICTSFCRGYRFLRELRTSFEFLCRDLANELERLRFKQYRIRIAIDEVLHDYKHISQRFFISKRRLYEMIEVLEADLDFYRSLTSEIHLREYAIEILRSAFNEIDIYIGKLNDLRFEAENLQAKFDNRVHTLLLACQDSNEMTYNFSYMNLPSITTAHPESIVDDFIQKAGFKISLIEDNLSVINDLERRMLTYVKSLQQVQKYKDKTISEVILSMSEQQYNELVYFINTHACRLLRLNSMNMVVGEAPVLSRIARKIQILTYGEDVDLKSKFETIFRHNCIPHENLNWYHSDASLFRNKMLIAITDASFIPYWVQALSQAPGLKINQDNIGIL